MAKKLKMGVTLAELLTAASPKILGDLVVGHAVEWLAVRRECFDYLKSHKIIRL